MAARSSRAHDAGQANDEAVVAKAVLRAADRLGIRAATLSDVIGVSEATISRLRSSTASLPRDGKPFELAVLFVRLYRSLDAIVGGDDAVARAWLLNPNLALGTEKPIDRIKSVAGLLSVIDYLDARRALV